MNYTAQDLFDYAMENEVVLEIHEVMEAMSVQLPTVADTFDYAMGMPLADLWAEIERREA